MARGMRWDRAAQRERMRNYGYEDLGGKGSEGRTPYRRQGVVFFSRYEGTCSLCREPYRAGERIRKAEQKGYQHACCPWKVARGGTKPAPPTDVLALLAEVERRHRPDEWRPRS